MTGRAVIETRREQLLAPEACGGTGADVMSAPQTRRTDGVYDLVSVESV